MTHHFHNVAQIGTKAADVAAAGSIGTAVALNINEFNIMVQIAAGMTAILAGLAAASFHAYKTYLLHKERERHVSKTKKEETDS